MDSAQFDVLSQLLGQLAEECHRRSRDNGFWVSSLATVGDNYSTLEVAAKIALIQSECSELLEAWREQDPYADCEKDPRLSKLDEEMADIAIRLLDLAHMLGLDLGNAIRLKMEYNATRPYKHSKRF